VCFTRRLAGRSYSAIHIECFNQPGDCRQIVSDEYLQRAQQFQAGLWRATSKAEILISVGSLFRRFGSVDRQAMQKIA